MKDQKELKYGGPKYKSQLKVFDRMIVVFEKASRRAVPRKVRIVEDSGVGEASLSAS